MYKRDQLLRCGLICIVAFGIISLKASLAKRAAATAARFSKSGTQSAINQKKHEYPKVSLIKFYEMVKFLEKQESESYAGPQPMPQGQFNELLSLMTKKKFIAVNVMENPQNAETIDVILKEKEDDSANTTVRLTKDSSHNLALLLKDEQEKNNNQKASGLMPSIKKDDQVGGVNLLHKDDEGIVSNKSMRNGPAGSYSGKQKERGVTGGGVGKINYGGNPSYSAPQRYHGGEGYNAPYPHDYYGGFGGGGYAQPVSMPAQKMGTIQPSTNVKNDTVKSESSVPVREVMHIESGSMSSSRVGAKPMMGFGSMFYGSRQLSSSFSSKKRSIKDNRYMQASQHFKKANQKENLQKQNGIKTNNNGFFAMIYGWIYAIIKSIKNFFVSMFLSLNIAF